MTRAAAKAHQTAMQAAEIWVPLGCRAKTVTNTSLTTWLLAQMVAQVDKSR